MGLLVYITVISTVFGAVFYCLFTPPSSFPRNIPTIPFYVSLLFFFKDVDQSVIYTEYLKEPLEKYGAVKIFFGSRWNIILQRPEYLNEIFRNEDTFAKSGNQKKIPHSVLSEYTGDNIISSHGENWRLYQSVIRSPLQAYVDIEPILKNARLLVDMLSRKDDANARGVLVYEPIQRYTMANIGDCLFSADFETLSRIDAPIHRVQLEVKRQIFNPIYLTFPFLDLLPIPSRKLARATARKFADMLQSTVTEGVQKLPKDKDGRLGAKILQARTRELWTEQQFRHNLTIMFIAGHENPQLSIISFLFLLGKHQDSQARLRKEILTSTPSPATASSLANMPYLNSVLYEVLRLLPPISQLINRRTTHDVFLGGRIHIPANTYVGYHATATHRDESIWGVNAGDFIPERWGLTIEEVNSSYRRATSKAHFITFHGGRRACLGQKFAMVQLRVTLSEIVRTLKWTIAPDWEEKMTPAGPLYPRMLKLVFKKI